MVKGRCLSYLAHIRDTSVISPSSLDSLCIICKSVKVFPTDLPSMSLNRDIDFSIDVEPNINPISIPSYRIAPSELNELKDQL